MYKIAIRTKNEVSLTQRAIPEDKVDDRSSDRVSFDDHGLSTGGLRAKPSIED
jgi:hypothetical protein